MKQAYYLLYLRIGDESLTGRKPVKNEVIHVLGKIDNGKTTLFMYENDGTLRATTTELINRNFIPKGWNKK